MKVVDLYARVRRACHVEGTSRRQAARLFGIDPKTVAKMLRFSVPPGYRRRKPPARPKLDPFVPVIDRVLEEDAAQPRKQRHTARRIFERLRAEHGFAGVACRRCASGCAGPIWRPSSARAPSCAPASAG